MKRNVSLFVVTILLLGACGSNGGGPSFQSVQACADQAGFTERTKAARAAGAAGKIQATPQELVAINACVGNKPGSATSTTTAVRQSADGSTQSQRTVVYGTPPAKPYYTSKRRRASVLSGGSGYHGSYLEGGTGSSYAAPAPPPRAKPQKTPKGKLPLPAQYAILPGDAELWPTLTLEEQQRALLFLEDGSTIRSSLRID